MKLIVGQSGSHTAVETSLFLSKRKVHRVFLNNSRVSAKHWWVQLIIFTASTTRIHTKLQFCSGRKFHSFHFILIFNDDCLSKRSTIQWLTLSAINSLCQFSGLYKPITESLNWSLELSFTLTVLVLFLCTYCFLQPYCILFPLAVPH